MLAAAALAACAPPWTGAARGGGPGSDDADGVGALADGGAVVAGAFTQRADVGPFPLQSAGGEDVFAARYRRDGTVAWARRFGGPGDDHVYDAATDASGASVLSGTFAGSVAFDATTLQSAGGAGVYGDAVVARLTPEGAVAWAQRMGGTGPDGGNEVAVERDGEIVLVADSGGPFAVGPSAFPHAGGRDAYLVKLGPDGALRWARQLGGSGNQQGRGVATAADGSVLVAGQFSGDTTLEGRPLRSAGSSDAFVARYAADGSLRWARSFGGATADVARGVGTDAAGDVWFSGTFTGALDLDGQRLSAPPGTTALYLARADADGRVRWARRLGGDGDNAGMELEVAADGTAYVAGSLPAGGGRTAFVAKVGPDGEVLWEKRPGGAWVTLDELALGPSGRAVTVLGRFAGSADLDGTALTGAGRTDWLVARLEEPSR